MQRWTTWLMAAVIGQAMAGAVAAQPKDTIYDEAKVPPYALPDPLVMQDGTRIADAESWRAKRRPEILRLFEQHVFGRRPKTSKKGGRARLLWGLLVRAGFSWPVRRAKGRFERELFRRPADPILTSLGLPARDAATNRFQLRLRLRFVDELAPVFGTGNRPIAEQLLLLCRA